MGNVQNDGLDVQVLNIESSNEQLATPALSPIAEHGTNGDYLPLNGLQADDYESQASDSTKKQDLSTSISSGLGKVNRKRNSHASLASPASSASDATKVLKLSPSQITDLTSSPGSLPLRPVSTPPDEIPPLSGLGLAEHATPVNSGALSTPSSWSKRDVSPTDGNISDTVPALASIRATPGAVHASRPGHGPRSASTPTMKRRESTTAVRNPKTPNDGIRSRRPSLTPIKTLDDGYRDQPSALKPSPIRESVPSPMPASIPLPPLSLPTYLQLELSAERPSALYIHRPASTDFPYESSKVKFERLLNFLLIPPELEQILCFGALACLDAWLYTFTILPLRFVKAVVVLIQWAIENTIREILELGSFVYAGLGRLWQRRQQNIPSSPRPSISEAESPMKNLSDVTSPKPVIQERTIRLPWTRSKKPRKTSAWQKHRRSRSTPSALLPNHKADILHGLLIVMSCMIMVRLDASRMYHSIRGQAAIKLYVIYNVLEVGDRLFSALGQDILECLFSKETLERKPNGRSKLIRPIWMFVIALVYNVIHATMLFYQVVTLNVAVNSYSNALLTLLMSNQFVEIKSTVFKKFEKENLFQITCADIVERFQLWLMLLIIALRNIVEVGGFSMSSITSSASSPSSAANTTTSAFLVPHAFTILSQFGGQVLSPFLIVLGSEMLVDWVKHAYINKFNSVSPKIYSRFLDVLAKDYYSHAFADQNLTKRLGLPVLPLSCLFIRAAVQTYHMFVATHMPIPLPAASTSISLENAAPETTTTAALAQIDTIIRAALGRSSFGAGGPSTGFLSWSLDDIIALSTMILFFLVLYLFLLLVKLVLGIILLNWARRRYHGMKEREREIYDTQSRRVGGWGVVEVDDEKRRWIYENDEDGLKKIRDREARERDKLAKAEPIKLDGVGRYMMASKRIW